MKIPIFDSHIHMDSRSANDYEDMAVSGVDAVLVPSTFTGQKKFSKEAFAQYFNRIVKFEQKRAQAFGIQLYCGLSIHPGDVHDYNTAFEALADLPSHIDNSVVCAIGEIAIRNYSPEEIDLFNQQLVLSQTLNIPAIIESPLGNNELKKLADILDQSIQKYGINRQKLVMVDLNLEKLPIVWNLKLGGYGIPVSPPLNGLFVIHRKVDPVEAKQIIETFGPDKILFNSALHIGYGDPMCISRTLLHLTQMKVPQEHLEQVAYLNSKNLFLRSK